jgi:hypothetical protein
MEYVPPPPRFSKVILSVTVNSPLMIVSSNLALYLRTGQPQRLQTMGYPLRGLLPFAVCMWSEVSQPLNVVTLLPQVLESPVMKTHPVSRISHLSSRDSILAPTGPMFLRGYTAPSPM